MADVYSIHKIQVNKTKSLYKPFLKILSRRHPRFRKLINLIGKIEHEVPIWHSINDAVIYCIIGQMLSLSASRTIIRRLKDHFKTSDAILKWSKKTINIDGAMMGVSKRKRKALAVWYDYYHQNKKEILDWHRLPLEDYRKAVNNIWGMGNWSADMIAIFHLGRMDIFPSTDTGIKKASRIIFETDKKNKIKKYLEGCETVASIYMWEMLNRKIKL